MNNSTRSVFGLLAITSGLATIALAEQSLKVTYIDNVEPILKANCVDCHTSGRQGAEESGLLMDSYEAIMRGSRVGPVIKPGSAHTSSLYLLVSGDKELIVRMPHGRESLSPEEIKTIKYWIDTGAPRD